MAMEAKFFKGRYLVVGQDLVDSVLEFFETQQLLKILFTL